MDICLQYEQTLDESHHGHPTAVQAINTGRHGWPAIYIDPNFLQWAYAHCSTSGITWFLHVGWWTVRNALLEYGIAEPQNNPFPSIDASTHNEILQEDDLLDPNIPLPGHIPTIAVSNMPSSSTLNTTNQPVVSFTGPLSALCNDALDDLILQLHSHFRHAGISMLDGMLRRLGHCLPQESIREALMCIDPVQWVFQHIWIRCWVYSAPGPNSLWHHDGQHGILHIFSLIPGE